MLVDWIRRNSYRFKTIATASNVLNVANNLTTLTVANENTMNVDTSTAVTFSKV